MSDKKKTNLPGLHNLSNIIAAVQIAKLYKINNGFNSDNIFLSRFLWYLKKILPENFGGFKINF